MLAGWQRHLFEENWALLDRARKALSNYINQKYNGELDCQGIEVFAQENNGTNLKISFVGKNRNTNEFKCFSGITNFKENTIDPVFKEDTFQEFEGGEFNLTPEIQDKIKNYLMEKYKDEEYKGFTPVKYFENIDGVNVICLKVDYKYAKWVAIYEFDKQFTKMKGFR